MTMQKPNKDELAAADKVINTDPKERGRETLAEALINRVEETLKIGNTGYTREVVLPIPLELINNDKATKEFVAKVGKVARDKSYHLPVKMEKENLQDVRTMNLVLKPTEDTDVKALKRLLL